MLLTIQWQLSSQSKKFILGAKSLISVISFHFISNIWSRFNIFGHDLEKTNYCKEILEQKRVGRMIRKIWGSLFFVLLSVYVSGQENRSISGTGNNLTNHDWGSANSQILRVTNPNYADGFSTPNDAHLPIPREISNSLFDQQDQIFDSFKLSDYVWVFGQFIDHDITLVESDDSEPVLLDIPSDDQYFSPSDFIFSSRNKKMDGSGLEPGNPRQYSNHISAFVDGSAIYGSDTERANWLRTFEDGKLKVSDDNLLPWNTESGLLQDDVDPNAPFMADDTKRLSKYFVAGDVRANENPLLISLHTVFVREHNRICETLAIDHPNWNDERIYQRARKLVGAYIQNILYNEWLPAMGVNLPEYRGYNDQVNPGIMNAFSAAAFRIGHTMINSNLLRMDNEGEEIIEGSIRLKDAYFNPQTVILSDGIDAYFKGMGTQVMQELDCKVISDLRNFLFGAPGSGGLDLASINIYRGRDRGLGSYNQLRSDFGLPTVKSFNDFTSSIEEAQTLENLYGSVDNVDAWVGMLAERHLNDAIFGELVMTIIESQFKNLRDGDRFYFENDPAFT
ncbi:MAG: hypothetical protein EX254_11065, partial [Flavobacteriaceae bacterium]